MKIISTLPMSIPSPAISDDISPSIPPAMLSSLCLARYSFRMPYNSKKLAPNDDFRSTKWDAGMHYDHTRQEYESSLEVDTIRASNCVVHRLIRSSPDGLVVEFSVHCPHGSFPHTCSYNKDVNLFNAVWESKIEVYRKYYKERVERFGKVQIDFEAGKSTEERSSEAV